MVCEATVRQAGDVVIVDLRGRITLGDGSGTLRDTVKRLIAGGHRRILLNLKDITHIDSAGLGELVGIYATVTNQDGQIRLLDVQTKVLDVLRVTKLYAVFENFTDETAALRSFAGRASAM
jgi:anti-sigma B factor antagonist